jgi:hypothetical protein
MFAHLFSRTILFATLALAACDRGTPAPSSATSPADKAAEKLQAAGEELKQAATQAATKAGPALERAKEEARDLTHRAAEKISDLTAPPASAPATQQ